MISEPSPTFDAEDRYDHGYGSSQSNDDVPRQMFGDNVAVSGGQFILAENVNYNIQNKRDKAFKLLHKHVTTSAFHNSAQLVDPPRCHPETRVAILQEISDWIMKSDIREEWLLWLNGAAGAGKSAIIRSVAEQRAWQDTITIASFFFFRTDPTRNTMAPLIATLVYQLIQAIPDIKNNILLTIAGNPLIFDQSLEFQIEQLIVYPLLRLPNHLQRLFAVFIDGLDECNNHDHQYGLIRALGNISVDKTIPVVFLVASRRETQIEAAFCQQPVFNLLRTISLDAIQASDDIQHFLIAKFKEIKATHLRRQFLPSNWPASADVDAIVTKSSGQFIFTSVVMNYISTPHAHPALQLDVIMGIRLPRPSTENPYIHLDALYQHIFSQAKDPKFVKNVLAFNFVTSKSFEFSDSDCLKIWYIEQVFQLAPGELQVCLADLTSVIECDPHTGKLKFLHASLPDFLLDKHRSGVYHIDLYKYHSKLLFNLLERALTILDPRSPTHRFDAVAAHEFWRLDAIQVLLKGVKKSKQLQRAFMNFKPTFHSFILTERYCRLCAGILNALKQLVC